MACARSLRRHLVSAANSRSIEWGTGFEIGGGVQGFPDRINGQIAIWPNQYTYGIQPFYYEGKQQSSFGYSHRMLVVDYTVPQNALNRNANLVPCRVQRVQEPVIESNFENGAPGRVFIVNGRGFSPFIPAKIELQKPGEASFSQLTTLHTNSLGELTFVLVIPDNAATGTYKVRISVVSPTISRAATTAISRELTLNVAGAVPQRTEQPVVGATTVNLDGRQHSGRW